MTKDFKELLYQDYPSATNNGLIYHLIHHDEFEDIEHILDCANKLTQFGNATPSGKFLKSLGKSFLIYRQALNYSDRGFDELVSQAELLSMRLRKKYTLFIGGTLSIILL